MKSCEDMKDVTSCNTSYELDAYADPGSKRANFHPVMCEWDGERCGVKMDKNGKRETCPRKCSSEKRPTCFRNKFPNTGYACGTPHDSHTAESINPGCPPGYDYAPDKRW